MKKKNLILVSGFALFSMFFGAGNLIFPPTLGLWVGSEFIPAILGFLLTAVGLVMLGVVATIKSGGNLENITGKLGNKSGFLFGTLVLLSIGPGLAIPRTAATTYELLQVALFENLNPIISSAVFFAIVLFFVLRPTDIVDNLGAILTPTLILLLVVVIVKGVVSPLSDIIDTGMKNVFARSFEEGYQTMDALAALAFTSVIINGYEVKNITDKSQIYSLTVKAAIIAALGLCFVYGGLIYIGATTSSLGIESLSRVELLIYIAEGLLGKIGTVAMCIIMILACLTTAIGLTSTFSSFFERMTNGKINYSTWAIIASVFSGLMAVRGVETIVKISVPVLSMMYPISIVLVVLNLFDEKPYIKRYTYIGGVIGALLPTISSILSSIGITPGFLDAFYGLFPETVQSFVWMIPAIVFAMTGTLLEKD
ncbi:branched-chain amino acid transport system II carrier protein [Peptoniphilus sp. ING2-D1G]|nr:branched-chain amino acid transport system II carrier protein [Peptoniphilus sp. ING2-D1G]